MRHSFLLQIFQNTFQDFPKWDHPVCYLQCIQHPVCHQCHVIIQWHLVWRFYLVLVVLQLILQCLVVVLVSTLDLFINLPITIPCRHQFRTYLVRVSYQLAIVVDCLTHMMMLIFDFSVKIFLLNHFLKIQNIFSTTLKISILNL